MNRIVRTRLAIGVCLAIAAAFVFMQAKPSSARVTIRNTGPSQISDIEIFSMFDSKTLKTLRPGEAVSFVMGYSPNDGIRVNGFICEGKTICDHIETDHTKDDQGEYYRFNITCDRCHKSDPLPQAPSGEEKEE